MVWVALVLLALLIVCVVCSSLSTASKWDDIECYGEDQEE